jgi:hypothetical protein
MANLPPDSSPTSNDTPIEFKVKEVIGDRLGKKEFKIQLQGLLWIAVANVCEERNETPKQLMQDLLESFLKREGYLPDWYR